MTSHVDVVLAEAERWTYPPFEAVERDGYIWGRGTVDMKGMTAFQLATMVALKRAGVTLERGVILLVLADEEAGMTWGSKWMVENQPDLIRAEYALNEVGGFSATVGGKRLFLVGTFEKGICWMRLTARGDTGHGSLPGGRNAVVAVAEAAARLSRARLGGEVRASARAFFQEVAEGSGQSARDRGAGVASRCDAGGIVAGAGARTARRCPRVPSDAAKHGDADGFASGREGERGARKRGGDR
ncbi:MAG: M20/M25/M40 family metallo-hydrolase [Tepidiformaceae bacterium]